MELHMQSTIFGQIVRWVSRNGKFKYPDEIDPSLSKIVVQPTPSQGPQQSQHSQELERTDGHIDGSEKEMQEGNVLNGDVEKNEQSMPPRNGPPDVLLVGWYGPDDPEASDSTASNMTCNFVPVADTLGSRKEPSELAQQLETPHNSPNVCSQLCRVHRKFDLRTRRGESHGRIRCQRGRCNAWTITFHLVRDASQTVRSGLLSG